MRADRDMKPPASRSCLPCQPVCEVEEASARLELSSASGRLTPIRSFPAEECEHHEQNLFIPSIVLRYFKIRKDCSRSLQAILLTVLTVIRLRCSMLIADEHALTGTALSGLERCSLGASRVGGGCKGAVLATQLVLILRFSKLLTSCFIAIAPPISVGCFLEFDGLEKSLGCLLSTLARRLLCLEGAASPSATRLLLGR